MRRARGVSLGSLVTFVQLLSILGQQVQSGLGKDHMKKTLLSGLKSDAKEAKAFRLSSFKDEDLLCIECSDEANCQSWVTAFQILLKVTQKWPQWLTK